jgi:succinate dehydrogenase / fumarate reductase, cytochrome b subunit
MSEAVTKKRQRFGAMSFAQTRHYRLPLAGIVSIFHRLSGMLLFVLLPFVLYLLEQSLTSEMSFGYFQGLMSHWLVKLLVLALVWSYLHHFCAGIRYLFMDVHIALDKKGGRNTAAAVALVSLTLTVLIGLKLYGVF